MKCLCCGKELPASSVLTGWHAACIKRFFGTRELPEIHLNAGILQELASASVLKGYTVTGVQKKLSLHLTEGSAPRLTLVGYPAGYILKPQVPEYPHMPEAEQLIMSMADACGITTVPHALLCKDGETAYVTKRVDRFKGADGTARKLAMEDFCQLDHKPTEEKYLGSYERCAKIIQRHSARAGFDLTELFMRLVFCFLTGNSDMHLKNFSLLQADNASSQYRLSPAYDLLPVQLFLRNDPEDTALTLNGKKQHLRRKDFLTFADTAGIPQKAAIAMLDRMLGNVSKWEALCAGSLLPAGMQEDLMALIHDRARRLAG